MTLIKKSPLDGGGYIESAFDWPTNTFLQCGSRGLVISLAEGGSYCTAFVEAFVEEGQDASGFYRGEGSSIAEAEKAVWDRYQAAIGCVHEWEPRGYTNGGAICKKCSKFGSGIFDGDYLGQFCVVCSQGTTWGRVASEWVCQDHYPDRAKERAIELQLKGSLSEKEYYELLSLSRYLEDA